MDDKWEMRKAILAKECLLESIASSTKVGPCSTDWFKHHPSNGRPPSAARMPERTGLPATTPPPSTPPPSTPPRRPTGASDPLLTCLRSRIGSPRTSSASLNLQRFLVATSFSDVLLINPVLQLVGNIIKFYHAFNIVETRGYQNFPQHLQ